MTMNKAENELVDNVEYVLKQTIGVLMMHITKEMAINSSERSMLNTSFNKC